MTYDRQAAAALAILARRGVRVTMTRILPGSRDVVAQNTTPATPQTQTVAVAIFPATVSRDATLDERAAVRRNQRLLYISARQSDGSPLAFDPEDGDTLPFENTTWRLAGTSRLAPDGGAPVLFTAEARR